MTEMMPAGIHRLQIPIPDNPLGYTNIYLIQGDSGYSLIDTGTNTDEALNSLKRGLSKIGVGFEDITQIIATHSHSDHYGLVGRLKKLSPAKIVVHYLEKDLIELRYLNRDKFLKQTARELHINGVPPADLSDLKTASAGTTKSVAPALPDVTLNGGEIISIGVFAFQVFWTPGHSPGHICLYEPTEKFLFSGDHILPTISPHIGLYPLSTENSLGDYINSLNTMKKLDVNLILPAHEFSFTNLQQRIEELFEHHKWRKLEALEVMGAEPKTAYQISAGMTWLSGKSRHNWQKMSSQNKRLAVLETVSHLESLRIDGKIDKFCKNSTIYYQQT